MIDILKPFKSINNTGIDLLKSYTPEFIKSQYNTIYDETLKKKVDIQNRITNISKSFNNLKLVQSQKKNFNQTKEYLKYSYIIIKKVKNSSLSNVNYDFLIQILLETLNENNTYGIKLKKSVIKTFKNHMKKQEVNNDFYDKTMSNKIYYLILKFKNLLKLKLDLTIIDSLKLFLNEFNFKSESIKDLTETFFLYAYCINLVFGEQFDSANINLDNFINIKKPVEFVKSNYSNLKENYIDKSFEVINDNYSSIKEKYVNKSFEVIGDNYTSIKENYIYQPIDLLSDKYNIIKENYFDSSVYIVKEKYSNLKNQAAENEKLKQIATCIFDNLNSLNDIKNSNILFLVDKKNKLFNIIKLEKQKIVNKSNDLQQSISNSEYYKTFYQKYNQVKIVKDDLYYHNLINYKLFTRQSFEFIKNMIKENRNFYVSSYHSVKFLIKQYFKNNAFHFQKYVDNSEIEFYYINGTFKLKRQINGLLIFIVHQKLIDYFLSKFHKMMTELHINYNK